MSKLGFAAPLTRSRWLSLASRIEAHATAEKVLYSTLNFIRWLYWADFLKLGIEFILAGVLEDGGMAIEDVWLYSRVIEDTLDTLLMRSRAEAELNRMATNVKKLQSVVDLWSSDSPASPSASFPFPR